jgi:uncharacterized lipoprotein
MWYWVPFLMHEREKGLPKRSRMPRQLLSGLSMLTLLGCATAPATYTFSSSKSYSRPYDQVWEDLVGFFAKNNIQIKNIAKDSGVIYAESATFSDNSADCGEPGLWRRVSRVANLNVFVARSTAEPTVQVNTKFFETRRFENSLTTVECNSKGVVERTIIELVTR